MHRRLFRKSSWIRSPATSSPNLRPPFGALRKPRSKPVMALAPMDLQSATVCITGGSSGIGLGLAERFLRSGSTVVVTGRRANALQEAKNKLPGLHTFQGDVGEEADRIKLVKWLKENFPKLNIFVANAGIMRRFNLASETESWKATQNEIRINLDSPIHFMYLLTPHFLKQPEACFVNLSSGLAFVPPTFAPVYGATKAGIHHFTLASRHAFEKTNVRLVEIVPPQVQSNLGGTERGEPLDDFCDSIFKRFAAGELEIGYNKSEEWRVAHRDVHKQVSGMMTGMAKPAQF